MLDRLLAIFAFLVLAGFAGILFWKVPGADLAGVIGVTLLLAGYDFFVHKQRNRS